MLDNCIEIEELSKEYRLGTYGYGSLYSDLQTWWALIRGKDDPNSIIDSNIKKKGRILALNNLNLKIKKGEIIGIIGPNGSGKSTLLKVLSRVTAPSKGIVKINGRVASLLEVGTGFHGELTGRDNIFLNGAINGMKKKEIINKFDQIVDFSGIGKYLDTPVKRYSSGMYIRLGFAIVVHLEPDILIIDEALAVGDASFRSKAINKMKEASNINSCSVLFVSHNMDAIRKICSKTVLLKEGKIIKYGSTVDVINEYMSLFPQQNSKK